MVKYGKSQEILNLPGVVLARIIRAIWILLDIYGFNGFRVFCSHAIFYGLKLKCCLIIFPSANKIPLCHSSFR
jgi:hypothetical protein